MPTILIIFIVVVAVIVAAWFIRQGMDKAWLSRQLIHRSIQDAEREARMKEPWPPTSGAKGE